MKLHRMTLALLALCASAVFGAPEPGIASNDLQQIQYAQPNAADEALRDAIQAELGSALSGTGEVRSVRFQWEGDDPTPIGVRGSLIAWDNLLVERYRVADLGEAVKLSDHDREDEDALRVIEFHGEYMVVLSGDAARDLANLGKLRRLCWEGAPARIDGAARQTDSDNIYYRFSRQAIDTSPLLQNHPSMQPASLQQLASIVPGAQLTIQGTLYRVDLGGGEIMSLDKAPDYTAIGAYSSPQVEAEMLAFADSVFAPAGGGMIGGLGGGGAAPAPPAPTSLALAKSSSGETFTIQQGGSIGLRLRGNPTTGYSWNVGALPAGLSLASEDFQGGGAGGPIGSGGTFVFEFAADAVGEHVLELDYRRPWEPAANAAETFTATIKVVAATPNAAPVELELDADDDGETVRIKKGGEILLSLDSNPSTGYDWNLSDTGSAAAIELTDSSFDVGGPGVGSGGKSHFHFSARESGTHTVTLEYRRPWEPAGSGVDSFTVEIEVVD